MQNAAVALIVSLVIVTAFNPAPAPPVTIPFEVATRHIIVKVTVNNSRPLAFVLDTGANTAIVRMATATELGLSLEGSAKTGGVGGGAQTGRLVKNATWSLVGLGFPSLSRWRCRFLRCRPAWVAMSTASSAANSSNGSCWSWITRRGRSRFTIPEVLPTAARVTRCPLHSHPAAIQW